MDILIRKKSWYKSKTIISAIIILILGIYNSSRPFLLNNYGVILPLIPEWLYSFFAVLGIKSRVDATTRIGK